MEPFAQSQWPTWGYSGVDPFSTYTQLPAYPSYLADSIEAAYQSSQQHLAHNHQLSRPAESKPRLSKEEVELLEAEFQKNHKPNSSTKKALAESMRVDNARINNWFQNRRAREKKENNIRAYEAKQRLEKEAADPGAGKHPTGDRQRDLNASSAPFPEPPKVSQTSPQSPTDSDAKTPHDDEEIHQSTEVESSSNASPIAPGLDYSLDLSISDPTSTGDYDDQVQAETEHSNHYLSTSDSASDARTPEVGMQSFGSYVPEYLLNSTYNFMGADESAKLGPAFPAHDPENGQAYADGALQIHTTDFDDRQFLPDGPFQQTLSPDMPLKSPPAIDIAARRNRRPPPLAINGARSFSSAAPKTAADLTAKRGDFGGSMRRVASASGPVRITKPSLAVAQRSPYAAERMADGLFQMNRSPILASHGGSIAPPTPNTPLVSSQQGIDEASTPFALDGKFPITDVVGHDPTLRTPPTTPGIMGQLFNLNAAYEMSMSDEPLATPGLARFPGEFEMPTLTASVPSYIAQDCASQPETPLYAPHMGPAYFGYLGGGNAEYNWSDASTSAKSSPGQSSQRVQFMNMTASSFSFGDEQ
ncbi:hypothetical protein S7711_02239 [Stachybotrys chartarum IBT 7711]|uniref:Homeobox domain-containing protein n=1 Tax=Stachybotrys chartarum (strain CBS 109288 / IBT 7711) TaxID=1280523 RepID=A0A084AZA7_STACB|nr:hypothetical protein S7711_02239 [Stachybotrys chartarum IBT 7711]KFA53054.1 hypothetical protein S40293_05324 [Stachybotrys chartarum IBT 40293]